MKAVWQDWSLKVVSYHIEWFLAGCVFVDRKSTASDRWCLRWGAGTKYSDVLIVGGWIWKAEWDEVTKTQLLNTGDEADFGMYRAWVAEYINY